MTCDVLELVSLRGKNPFKLRPSNEVLVPLYNRVFFLYIGRAPPYILMGVLPPPPSRGEISVIKSSIQLILYLFA